MGSKEVLQLQEFARLLGRGRYGAFWQSTSLSQLYVLWRGWKHVFPASALRAVLTALAQQRLQHSNIEDYASVRPCNGRRPGVEVEMCRLGTPLLSIRVSERLGNAALLRGDGASKLVAGISCQSWGHPWGCVTHSDCLVVWSCTPGSWDEPGSYSGGPLLAMLPLRSTLGPPAEQALHHRFVTGIDCHNGRVGVEFSFRLNQWRDFVQLQAALPALATGSSGTLVVLHFPCESWSSLGMFLQSLNAGCRSSRALRVWRGDITGGCVVVRNHGLISGARVSWLACKSVPLDEAQTWTVHVLDRDTLKAPEKLQSGWLLPPAPPEVEGLTKGMATLDEPWLLLPSGVFCDSTRSAISLVSDLLLSSVSRVLRRLLHVVLLRF